MEHSITGSAAASCESTAELHHRESAGHAHDGNGDGGTAHETTKWNDTELLNSCLRRICSWRVPPNWSAQDWLEEMRLQGAAALWQARLDYDASRGVPQSAFGRLRVLASARTRYRQEWRYSLRCRAKAAVNAEEDSTDEPAGSTDTDNALPEALATIPEADQWLIEQLFWAGCSEAIVAKQLGISQPAVNKRKQAVLRRLQRWLVKEEEHTEERSTGWL